MKRVIQCPKCQAKLSVFDIGKPINQKCPKCGNAFVVDSEDAKPAVDAKNETPVPAEAVAEKSAPATPKTNTGKQAKNKGDEKSEVQPEVKTEPKTEGKTDPQADSKSEAKANITEEPTVSKADVKDVTLPKPAPKPCLPKPDVTPSFEPEFPEHHSGVSFLHIVVIIGLLMLVIVMQVLAKRNMERRFVSLETQLSDVHKALSTQILKNK